ncbi:MAG TPA: SUMF1/EgtB/PvdO family nonheme iron enzyme [Nevskiaceae bacterium]|nr:SUMF1/EgtB/PvdO family nonheme iron enzyme [Nevskiaceae bacterium]
MYQKHCPGCFENKHGAQVCPHCGYDEAMRRLPRILAHGTMLAETYRIGRVLGKPGGFGVTYLAWDSHLQQRVAIKEYLPRDIADRENGKLEVTVAEQDRAVFERGRDKFLREARIVAKLDHPSIVRVLNFFRANGTAYMVMRYYHGMTLGEYMSQRGSPLPVEVAVNLLWPVIEGLQHAHQHHLLHRDIKPNNIYLTSAGVAILLDFGAAREQKEEGEQTDSVMLTDRYAAIEQYHGKAQGPWTDVYGFAALLYRLTTGQLPPGALERVSFDTLAANGLIDVPEALREPLSKGLELYPEKRCDSLAEFRARLEPVMYGAPESVRHDLQQIYDTVGEVRRVQSAAGQAPAAQEPVLPEAPVTEVSASTSASESASEMPTVQAEAVTAAPRSVAKPKSAPAAPRSWRWPLAGTAAAIVLLAAGAVLMRRAPHAIPPLTTGDVLSTAPADAPQAAEIARAPGDDSILAVRAPRMVRLRGGDFRLGSDAPLARTNEQPPQPVHLKPFAIALAEVTRGEFRAFVEHAHYDNPFWRDYPCDDPAGAGASWQHPGGGGEDQPVVCVSAADARAYAAWLAQALRKPYRLPTEAEFEYAQRGGSGEPWWWGNGPVAGHAVCADCSAVAPQGPSVAAGGPVNPYGLYGAAGNVREWTCSEYQPLAAGAWEHCAARPDILTAIRGGSWHDGMAALRSSYREVLFGHQRDVYTGFRLAQD